VSVLEKKEVYEMNNFSFLASDKTFAKVEGEKKINGDDLINRYEGLQNTLLTLSFGPQL
jgi:hypothetical protein